MRSSKSMTAGAASHIALTGGWLARKSPPYTVSSKCCQVESPSPFKFLAALMPPCAHTECERLTGTIENRSTSPPISAIFMTAASPASPPPTTMIFGLDIFYRIVGVHQRIVNESISFPIDLNGCCRTDKNEYIVTAPTAINPIPIIRHTWPQRLCAIGPCVIPH